jgi:hypothetical protein
MTLTKYENIQIQHLSIQKNRKLFFQVFKFILSLENTF